MALMHYGIMIFTKRGMDVAGCFFRAPPMRLNALDCFSAPIWRLYSIMMKGANRERPITGHSPRESSNRRVGLHATKADRQSREVVQSRSQQPARRSSRIHASFAASLVQMKNPRTKDGKRGTAESSPRISSRVLHGRRISGKVLLGVLVHKVFYQATLRNG